jgi:hypothetical protein
MAVISCHYSPLTSSPSNGGCKIICPEFPSHIPEAMGRLRHNVCWHSKGIAKQNSAISSLKLQQTCEGILHFILA